jgi:hypothetical protein
MDRVHRRRGDRARFREAVESAGFEEIAIRESASRSRARRRGYARKPRV